MTKRRHNGIVGVALNAAGKFLGFIDGKGKIRKGRVRRLRNPVISTPKTWARQKAEWDKRYQVSIHNSRVPTRAFSTLTEAKNLIKRAKSYHGTHWDIYDRETGQ